LKGSNIYVSNDGTPLIASAVLAVTASTNSTRVPVSVNFGQLDYLRWMARELQQSPEASCESRHTNKSDVWSFGMVIYELLTRSVPYSSIPINQVAAVICRGQLPQEPEFHDQEPMNSVVRRVLWSLCCQCLLQDPSMRPSAMDILNDVRILLADSEKVVENLDETNSTGIDLNSTALTMIGAFFFKYTRGVFGKGSGERRHKRFFWVRPSTRMLYWSSVDPTSDNAPPSEMKIKCARIDSISEVSDFNPFPRSTYNHSLVILMSERELKITAPTREMHESWLHSLRRLVDHSTVDLHSMDSDTANVAALA